MKMRFAALATLLLSPLMTAPGTAASLPDRVDTPAIHSPKALQEPVLALAAAGQRVVAAGVRGHVFWSDDQGEQWQQADVPVSSDLTDVFFVSPQRGWAVGHDGVVLRTDDGGATWQRQLDGHAIAALYAARADTLQDDDPELARRYRAYAEQGLNQSLLTAYFDNENEGYVAGAYNLLLRTEDGGEHWTPWLEQVDNPGALHLYGMRRIGGQLYMAGEQGLLLRQAAPDAGFDALTSPYGGTWFGLAGYDDVLLVYGLRGNVWVSHDQGASWQASALDSHAAITGASVLPAGDILLVSQSGVLFRSSDRAHSFSPVSLPVRFSFFDVLALSADRVVVAGLSGLRTLPLPGRARGEQ
ncbi:glycosyl hydrolase [Alcanivorax sp. S71-1-4]|uniref:WD40/YVTN/BNR-like repeat-containing protein n=1 Tax=Alcanivorax sp. S71-1-4 TaxID=1177159 RepID=UPI0013585F8C|nr:YCF48-related protein [Alcanivorax sp. S71-1-4]KAF0809987.1 glycosyl hydrolase [Alcanivorax sp. S71-1-4]